jgi:hypothetical protein
MKEKKMDLYKWLWSRVGGRPWTYIIRDFYHTYEWAVFLTWFWIGVAVFRFGGLLWCGFFWLLVTLGYVLGHFFWGTPWRRKQK